MVNLKVIQNKVNILANKINTPANIIPTFGRTIDFGHPHIEVDKHGYHFIVVERGEEISRKTSQDIEELLYYIFAYVTFSMACDYEVKNRVPKADFRRMLFNKQLELLALLNEDFRVRREEEISKTLKIHPFMDEMK